MRIQSEESQSTTTLSFKEPSHLDLPFNGVMTMLTMLVLMTITRKDIAEDGEQAKEGEEALQEGEEGSDEGGGAQSWGYGAGLFYDLLSFSFAPFLFRAFAFAPMTKGSELRSFSEWKKLKSPLKSKSPLYLLVCRVHTLFGNVSAVFLYFPDSFPQIGLLYQTCKNRNQCCLQYLDEYYAGE